MTSASSKRQQWTGTTGELCAQSAHNLRDLRQRSEIAMTTNEMTLSALNCTVLKVMSCEQEKKEKRHRGTIKFNRLTARDLHRAIRAEAESAIRRHKREGTGSSNLLIVRSGSGLERVEERGKELECGSLLRIGSPAIEHHLRVRVSDTH